MNNGRFLIDDSIPQEEQNKIIEKVKHSLEKMKNEISEREPILNKRQDFYEGRHHKWTNVVGQAVKQKEGHILAVFNYINRFATKVQQTITNNPPKMKIKSRDESNEIETTRAEAVEQAVYDILKKNFFWNVIFKRCTVNQIRDGDFTFECKVVESDEGRRVVITPNEDLLKIMIGWDNASGSTFSFAAFTDMWTLDKIKREYDYDAEPMGDSAIESQNRGDHVKDQYGIFATQGGGNVMVPSGKSQLPKAKITDYWGYEYVNGELVILNLILINEECVQLVKTDYKKIPRFVGHSMVVAGKPWSMSFIDPLIDPQVELNDRTGEEGDMVRIGAHTKFLAINMTDFDADSIKPGSGQVIFVEGENSDFRQLQVNANPFPSESYLNRVMEHMFTLGIPKISLAAGTAPYTGKVGAIQYQPFADLINDFRIQWEVVLEQLVITIQEYLIEYFPESHAFMRESLYDETTGEYSEGELVIRDVEFDWENVLPLSRSDKVVDASTLRDRNAISLHTYLEEAGFRDPGKEIKKLKKEAKDKELMTLVKPYQQYSPGVVKAQLEARQEQIQAEEANAELMGSVQPQPASTGSQPSTPPILSQSQNDGRRGVLTGTGTPSGQTATPKGAVAQASQNMNARGGV